MPLAVAQAAAFLDETGMDPKEYLRLLDQRAQDTLARGRLTGYPDSMAASWAVAFDRLEADSPAGLALLSIAAWMAPEPVPLALFTAHPDLLPEPLAAIAEDPLALADLTALLRRRALARVDTDAVQLHRLVQTLLRGPTRPPLALYRVAVRAPAGSGSRLRVEQPGLLAGLAATAAACPQCHAAGLGGVRGPEWPHHRRPSAVAGRGRRLLADPGRAAGGPAAVRARPPTSTRDSAATTIRSP